MADTSNTTADLSGVPDAGPLLPDDLIPLVRAGATRRTTLAALGAFLNGKQAPAGPTESASGSTLTDTSGQILDKGLAVWTLIPSALGGLGVALNGKLVQYTANVALLLYWKGVIYQKNTAGGWWAYLNNAFSDSGDPRAVSAVPTTPAPSGTGPAASGSLVTADFGAPTGQAAPAALWGIAAAAPNDRNFALCADPAFLAAAAQVMPALYRINCNSGQGSSGSGYWSDAIFANGVGNPNWNVVKNLVQNGYKFLSPSCRLVIGVRFNAVKPADYGSMCGQMARYFKSTPGGDGKPLPVWGWEVGNEDDGVDINTYCQYFNAAADALHAVDAGYKVIGTVDSYCHGDRMKALGQQCGSKLGALCYHSYRYLKGVDPVPDDAGLFASSRPANDIKTCRSAVAGTPAANVPIFMGEYNAEGAAKGDPRMQKPIGAAFVAFWILQAFKTGLGLEGGAMWEMALDGDYGVVQGSAVSPAGRFLGKAGAVMGGQEVKTTSASAKLMAHAVVNGGKIGVMLVNIDAAPVSGKVALSRWPLGPSGNGPVERWEVSDAFPQGSSSRLAVSGGMTDTVTVPAKGVVILSA